MSNITTKDFLIQTAYELFIEKGYNAVTVQDICEACKITKTTFYYHMKSKEDIIINIYDSITKNLSQYLVDIISADNYWEQLMTCFEILVKESVKYGTELQKQLFISNLKEDRGSYDFREDLTRVAITVIEKAQAAGQIRNQSPAERLYRASAYAFLGYEITWCIKGEHFDAFKHIRQAMEQIYDVAPELRSC